MKKTNLNQDLDLVNKFNVEELEERLENKWGGSKKSCLVSITYHQVSLHTPTPTYQALSVCPSTQIILAND